MFSLIWLGVGKVSLLVRVVEEVFLILVMNSIKVLEKLVEVDILRYSGEENKESVLRLVVFVVNGEVSFFFEVIIIEFFQINGMLLVFGSK